MNHAQSSLLWGSIQILGRKNTVPFPNYPAGYKHGKRQQEDDAERCKGQMQGNRQAGIRPADRNLGISQGSPHRSLARSALGLVPRLTDHSDLRGNKYIVNLPHNSVTTADFWSDKLSIQTAVAHSMHKTWRSENISPLKLKPEHIEKIHSQRLFL